MRCLVTGAYGFIGREVVAALLRHGHQVVAAGRDVELGRRLLPDVDWIACDFNRDLTPQVWQPRLEGIDAIVNAVGILQATAVDDETRIHVTAVLALATAAAASGARFVHISAMSADEGVGTGYARSKSAADRQLADVDGDWLIVKPSLVIGRGSHGGTSLLRAAAALPFSPRWRHRAPSRSSRSAWMTSLMALSPLPGGASRQSHDAGCRRTGSGDPCRPRCPLSTLARIRAGAGATIPASLLRLVAWFGDIAGYFGSPTALRSTSFAQMSAMPIADPRPYSEASGVPPRPLSRVFAAMPSTVQDRLHARLYFLRAGLQVTLALFWIVSGFISLLPGPFAKASGVLTSAGLGGNLANSLVAGGAFLDLLLGLVMLTARGVRSAAIGQICLAAAYLLLGTLLTPALWLDPLGPFVKVVPIIVATLLLLAIAEKR